MGFKLVAGPYEGMSEGPAWDGEAMLFTDIPNSRIMRFDPEAGDYTEYRTDTRGTNGLMFDAEGRLYGCPGWSRTIALRSKGFQHSSSTLIGRQTS